MPPKSSSDRPATSMGSKAPAGLEARLLLAAGLDDVVSLSSKILHLETPHREAPHMHEIFPGPRDPTAVREVIGQLRTRITELEKVAERIKRAAISVKTLCVAVDPSISPISRLPPETLLQIFEIGARYDLDQLLYPPSLAKRSASRQFAQIVSHVCASWRSLAIHRSSLWTQIRPTWNSDQVRTWLLRCKHQPIDIDLWNPTHRIPSKSMKLLSNLAPRWRSISIHLFSPYDPGSRMGAINDDCRDLIFHPKSRKPAPSFDKLEIFTARSAYGKTFMRMMDVHDTFPFFKFPVLRNLCLREVGVDFLYEMAGNLTHMEADFADLYPWEYMPALTNCKQLETLIIRSSIERDPQFDDDNGMEHSELPALRHLCFDTVPPEILDILLRSMTAPHLDSLHIRIRGGEELELSSLARFVSVHQTVTSLMIMGHSDAIDTILLPWKPDAQPFPRLTKLTVCEILDEEVPFFPSFPMFTLGMLDHESETPAGSLAPVIRRFVKLRQELSAKGTHEALQTLRIHPDVFAEDDLGLESEGTMEDDEDGEDEPFGEEDGNEEYEIEEDGEDEEEEVEEEEEEDGEEEEEDEDDANENRANTFENWLRDRVTRVQILHLDWDSENP